MKFLGIYIKSREVRLQKFSRNPSLGTNMANSSSGFHSIPGSLSHHIGQYAWGMVTFYANIK
jgi:hypothetical protein